MHLDQSTLKIVEHLEKYKVKLYSHVNIILQHEETLNRKNKKQKKNI